MIRLSWEELMERYGEAMVSGYAESCFGRIGWNIPWLLAQTDRIDEQHFLDWQVEDAALRLLNSPRPPTGGCSCFSCRYKAVGADPRYELVE